MRVLDSGAAAVEVTTIFDGVTIEQQLLWRGGAIEARDPTGAAVVRLGDGGFELLRPDGERVAIGPSTRVTVTMGGVRFVVAGTTRPRRLPTGAPLSWKRHAGLLAVALAGVVSGALLTTVKAPRASYEIPEIVRKRIALLGGSLSGGTHSMKVSADLRPPVARAEARQASQAPTPTPMRTPATSRRRVEAGRAAVTLMAMAEREKSAAELESLRAQRLDDAKRAVAIRAREAGVVGAMAHVRAQFLGSEHVVAAELSDAGAIAIAGADGASGASGNAGSSSDGNSGAGSGNGSNSGGDATGTLDGTEIGEAYGVGGLGLSGSGEGGGGAGDSIGIGNVGTIGYGGGSGTGYGYGRGEGGLGGRRAHAPDVIAGLAEVRGSCDKDLIRRVVRAHVDEVRFCYERALQSRPSLTGRAVTRFVIGYDGRVTSSQIASSTVSSEVDACLAQAIARWQFVPRCVGEVSYPFTFIRTAP